VVFQSTEAVTVEGYFFLVTIVNKLIRAGGAELMRRNAKFKIAFSQKIYLLLRNGNRALDPMRAE